jgi:Arc/MetJ-type ribon-helix-helix transcriptional regulator
MTEALLKPRQRRNSTTGRVGPEMTGTNVYLTHEQRRWLNAQVDAGAPSLSEVVRRLLDGAMKKSSRKSAGDRPATAES